MRRFKMECFLRAMIEFMHDSLNCVIGYVLKATSSLVGLKKRQTIAANLFLFRVVAIALMS